MLHLRESSSMQSSALARLHRAGKTLSVTLWNAVKTRPGLWLGLATLAVYGVAWAVMKLAFASGGGFVLALLRDAGHQVGGGGLPGALGGGMMGGGSASGRAVRGEPGSPPLEPDYKPPPPPLSDDQRRALDDFLKTSVRTRKGKSDWGKKGSPSGEIPVLNKWWQGWW